ncbi:MAG: hypothetical protein ABI462_09795 [Ignavibacteria bacterium]
MIDKENISEEKSRDLYWGRFIIKDENSDRKTKVLLCASWEFLCDEFRVENLTPSQINLWYESIIEKWVLKGEEIFSLPIHYLTFTNTEEGKENALKFLMTEVK